MLMKKHSKTFIFNYFFKKIKKVILFINKHVIEQVN